jgi:hypothetical protein
MLYAHYFASRSRKELVLSLAAYISKFDATETVVVSGKREARRIANERGAQCWNF